MLVACLEAELLDSEVSSNSKHGIVQVAALPIHRNRRSVWQPVMPGIVWMSAELPCRCNDLVHRRCVLCNQRKHSKYTVCTTDYYLFPYYCITGSCSLATLRCRLQAVLRPSPSTLPSFISEFLFLNHSWEIHARHFVLCSICVLAEKFNEQYIVHYYRTLTFECADLNTVLWLSVHRSSIVLPVALWNIQPLKCTRLNGQVQTCWPVSTE
jgi:hypothetical protein